MKGTLVLLRYKLTPHPFALMSSRLDDYSSTLISFNAVLQQ